MRKLYFLFMLKLTAFSVFAQMDSLTKSRFVIGLSAPELIHAGINIDLSTFNQVGISAGIGPSWGEVWPTLNVEHRFYFGNMIESTNRRRWFFKQGATYFPAGESQSAITLTVGGDLKSKKRNSGWTIDVGAFFLFQQFLDRRNQVYPALRFQRYSYFKKARRTTAPER